MNSDEIRQSTPSSLFFIVNIYQMCYRFQANIFVYFTQLHGPLSPWLRLLVNRTIVKHPFMTNSVGCPHEYGKNDGRFVLYFPGEK